MKSDVRQQLPVAAGDAGLPAAKSLRRGTRARTSDRGVAGDAPVISVFSETIAQSGRGSVSTAASLPTHDAPTARAAAALPADRRSAVRPVRPAPPGHSDRGLRHRRRSGCRSTRSPSSRCCSSRSGAACRRRRNSSAWSRTRSSRRSSTARRSRWASTRTTRSSSAAWRRRCSSWPRTWPRRASRRRASSGAWFEKNSAKFAQPPRLSLRHLYFSPDRRGARARDDAAAGAGEARRPAGRRARRERARRPVHVPGLLPRSRAGVSRQGIRVAVRAGGCQAARPARGRGRSSPASAGTWCSLTP